MISIITIKEKKRRNYLYFISFMKFLAMIIIIRFHIIPRRKINIDYGARMCEFLFVCSGFLVGYNHYKNEMDSSFHQSFKYSYKSFRTFYPLELLNIIVIFIFIQKNKLKTVDLTRIELLMANIFMLKSWGPTYVAFSFNGPSWFLGSLLFCYIMTPLLLCGIKNYNRAFILFILISLIRVGIEEFINHGAINIFLIQIHVGPIIRCMEFYLGMLIIPLFFIIKDYCDKMKNKNLLKIFDTIIQITLPLCFYLFMLKFNKSLLRCYYVLIFTFLTFILALDYGYLSNLFSMKFFKKLINYQLEMFLLQGLTITTIKIITNDYKWKNYNIKFLIILIIIYILSFIYKTLFKDSLTKILDKFIYIFGKI